MKWRELHTSPIVVWASVIIGVAGFVYGIWANHENQPKYEISYYQGYSTPLINLDLNGPNELIINGEKFSQGIVYSNVLYIWNSGNQSITINETGDPLQWPGAPANLKTSYFGIRADQVDGEIKSGLRFKLLYPGTGLAVNFYGSTVPEINMSGAVSGGQGSGLIKRTLWQPQNMGKYVVFGLTILIALSIYTMVLMNSRRRGEKNSILAHVGVLAMLVLVGFGITGLLGTIIAGILNANLPPF